MQQSSNEQKYLPDWKQPLGKTTERGSSIHIHPYDLIAHVQKKRGIEKACELAIKLITKKYNQLFENAKMK